MKLKEREQILLNENKFLTKQVKDARKQNRLLKIAISKLQSDFDRVARESKHPLNISYSLDENDKDNILSRIERVMENSKDADQNHEEMSKNDILAKLESESKKISSIAQTKIDSYADYTHDEGLRNKLNEAKDKANKSYSDYKNPTFQKYELIKKNLAYSPIKIRNKKPKTREIPVGSAQKISSIKKRLGGDDKWKQF